MLISGGGTKNSALIDDLHENAGKKNPDLEQGSNPLVKRIPQKMLQKKRTHHSCCHLHPHLQPCHLQQHHLQ
jgi:hypothetical protein